MYLLVGLRHHLPSWGKYGLHLGVLHGTSPLILVAGGRMLRLLNFTGRDRLHAMRRSVIFVDTPVALASSVEKALHAV